MKKKNNINETDGTAGGTNSGAVGSTSTTTATANKTTSSTTGKKHPTVYTKKIDLKNTMKNLSGVEADVVVLEYLSEVKDAETGQMSQPFTINGKKYQVVRARTPKREEVMGVYSFNEVNDKGENKIYSIQEFEENIAKKAIEETGVVEPEGPEAVTLNTEEKKEEVSGPSFVGYKHFIVNPKTGKAKKFKSIEELAKAQMGEGEKYMGIKEFKKFVDESLFGAAKRSVMREEDVVANGQESDEEMNIKAKKLMAMISKRIPETVIKTIKTPIAQREVIAAFAEMIGVPRNGLTKLISGLKDIAKTGTNKPQPIDKGTEPTPANTAQPVTEGRKIIQTIKVKDIK
jgi:hypothetical protein